MKKCMSLIIILIFILSSFSTSLATETDGGLIFDLDITSSVGEATTVADRTANVTITSGNIPKTESETINGNQIKYVNFYTESNQMVAYMSLPNNKVCNYDNTTIEAFIKPQADENIRTIFSVSSNFGNSVYYAAFKGQNLIVKTHDREFSIDIGDNIGKWGHYIFVRSYNENSCTIEVYLNNQKLTLGEEGDEVVLSPKDDGEYDFFIGAPGKRGTQKDYTTLSSIAEFRIYDYAFNASNVLERFLDKAETYGLIGNQTPDEPQEPDFPEDGGLNKIFELDIDNYNKETNIPMDSTGNINGLEVQGSAVDTEELVSVYGNKKILKFMPDGQEMLIKVPAEKIVYQDIISAELWVKYEELFVEGKYQHPFGYEKSTGWDNKFSPEMFIHSSGNRIAFGNAFNVATPLTPWVQLVFQRRYNKDKKECTYLTYMNAKLVNEVTTSYELAEEYSTFYIGGNSNIAQQYLGSMGKFALYSGELTLDDIGSLYNSQKDYYVEPQFYEESGNVNINTTNLKFNSTGTLDFNDLKESNIDLINASTGESIKTKLVSKSDTMFEINLSKYLDYNTRYKISLMDKKAYMFFLSDKCDTIYDFKLYDKQFNMLDNFVQSDSYICRLDLKNNSQKEKTYEYMIVFKNDKNQQVKTVFSKDIKIGSNDSECKYETVSDVKDAKQVYLYLWERVGESLIPIDNIPYIIK
ncbi:MAG: LamG-like jellyroll fold domain-containing protein [Clostridia bacterium]|nr:LamG-like jellyroll fold domain-containing protein [Clostridia bacterium]